MKKCVDCDKPICDESWCEYFRQKPKERLLKRKVQGICRDCGKPAIDGRNYCASCLEKFRQRRADAVRLLNIEGICQACCSKPVHIKQDGKLARYCSDCLAKRRLWESELRKKGRCINCEKPVYIKPDGTQARYCEEHFRHYNEMHRRRYNELKRKGLCTRCGQTATSNGAKILTVCDDCLKKLADSRYRRKKGL